MDVSPCLISDLPPPVSIQSRQRPLDHKIALRAWFAAIPRIRASGEIPFFRHRRPESTGSRATPATSRSGRPCQVGLRRPSTSASRRWLRASLEGAASKSFRICSSSTGAASPMGCRFGARIGCPLEQRVPGCGAARPSVSVSQAEAGDGQSPRGHQGEADVP